MDLTKKQLKFNLSDSSTEGIAVLLECKSILVMKVKDDSISVLSTNEIMLNHYLDKKYYLNDPSLKSVKDNQAEWQINLGIYCYDFRKTDLI